MKYTIYPIEDHIAFDYYMQARSFDWKETEILLDQDIPDWENKLNQNEKYFIKHILAFFASSDSLVNENLAARFYTDTKSQEARAFYSFQMAIETVHSITYSMLLESFIKDEIEKNKLYNAIETMDSIKKKAEWCFKYLESSSSYAERLIAFACVEGIFFSGSFCSLFWLKKRKLMPGLTFSNELISRDEAIHTDFACYMYSKEQPLDKQHVKNIIIKATDLEKEFICDSLPVDLIGMNNRLMSQYIEFVADRLSMKLINERIYNSQNPFDFMITIAIDGKTNFFEKKVSEYKKYDGTKEINDFNLSDNF